MMFSNKCFSQDFEVNLGCFHLGQNLDVVFKVFWLEFWSRF